jgi:hypothetical protein
MASASAGVDVPGHIYTSTKEVLAHYIVQLREIRLGELLARQRGEIQLLLLAQIAWVYAKPIPFPIRANKPIPFIGNAWAYWKNAS